MSEEVQVTTNDATGQEPVQLDAGRVEATQPGGVETLPEWAQAEIKNLRQESAKRRNELRVAEKAAQAAEEAKLTQQAEWQKLAEQRQARIAELEPLQEQIQGYVDTVTELLEKRVTTLGDAAKTAVDGLPEGMDSLAKLKWLDANSALFAAKPLPQIDASTKGVADTAGATDEQVMRFAADMGLNPKTVDPKLVPIDY